MSKFNRIYSLKEADKEGRKKGNKKQSYFINFDELHNFQMPNKEIKPKIL